MMYTATSHSIEEGIDEIALFCKRTGVSVKVVNYGATVTSVKAPDRNSNVEEITLCYETIADLKEKHGPYFGCIAGRYANRIKEGKFTIGDENYQLAVNNGLNALHGGFHGFDQQIWTVERIICEEHSAGVELSYTSVDGEEGYPGKLKVTVIYLLSENHRGDSELSISFSAVADKTTPINLTNHTYFNLSGSHRRPITQQRLRLYCNHYLPVDSTQIPIGVIQPAKDTLFDFTGDDDDYTGKLLGDVIPLLDGCGKAGVDHCFVVAGALEADTSNLQLLRAALLTDDVSGRQLEVHTTQPGIQVYSANWLSESPLDHPYTQYNGLCLETQHFPNSPNQANFPNTLLRPGCVYNHRAVYTIRTLP